MLPLCFFLKHFQLTKSLADNHYRHLFNFSSSAPVHPSETFPVLVFIMLYKHFRQNKITGKTVIYLVVLLKVCVKVGRVCDEISRPFSFLYTS